MIKRYFILIVIVFLSFAIFGCKTERQITLKSIEKNLFLDIDQVYISKDWNSNLKELEQKEIQTLKKAIKNGVDLTVFEGDMPSPKINGNSIVLIVLTNKRHINMLYESQSGYMYVTQEDVHWREEKGNESNLTWVTTNLTGIYKFRPGSEFKELLAM